MIERQQILMFSTKIREKLHCFDQIAGGKIFEVQGRCSPKVMIPV